MSYHLKQAKARYFASEYISSTCLEKLLEIAVLKDFADFMRKYP